MPGGCSPPSTSWRPGTGRSGSCWSEDRLQHARLGRLPVVATAGPQAAEEDQSPDRGRHSSRQRRDRQARTAEARRSEEHTSELQSRFDLVCRLLLEKKNKNKKIERTNNTN